MESSRIRAGDSGVCWGLNAGEPAMIESRRIRSGMTLVELMVVLTILAILTSIISVSMLAGRSAEAMLKSQNHLRQIAQWIDQYASNHRSTVVPARFDYWDEESEGGLPNINRVGGTRFFESNAEGDRWLNSPNPFVPSSDPEDEGAHQGSWADVLWVDANLGGLVDVDPEVVDGAAGTNIYGGTGPASVSAPGWWLYAQGGNEHANPLRSAAPNGYHYPLADESGNPNLPNWSQRGIGSTPGDVESRPQGLPTPVGGGAWEEGLPGFFAANAFFDARSRQDITGDSADPAQDRFVSHAQVRAPARSIFLVDSFRGETIGESPLADEDLYRSRTMAAWAVDRAGGALEAGYRPTAGQPTQEVDFRYGGDGAGSCLMLHLDGSIHSQTPWNTYLTLVGGQAPGGPVKGRNVRIMDLDRRLQP